MRQIAKLKAENQEQIEKEKNEILKIKMCQLQRDFQGLKQKQMPGKFVDNSETQTDFDHFNVLVYSNDKLLQQEITKNEYEKHIKILLTNKILKNQKINFDSNMEEINEKITKF